jgi:hypothetical protein
MALANAFSANVKNQVDDKKAVPVSGAAFFLQNIWQ